MTRWDRWKPRGFSSARKSLSRNFCSQPQGLRCACTGCGIPRFHANADHYKMVEKSTFSRPRAPLRLSGHTDLHFFRAPLRSKIFCAIITTLIRAPLRP